MIRILWIVAALGLAGCSSLVAAGMARLAGLSPLTSDPEGFVVAIDLPDGIAIPPGAARITFQAARSDTGQTSQGSYALQEGRTDAADVTYRIAPADLDRFRTQQALIAGWEDEDPDATTGSFSVRLTACATGAGPAPDATVSVAMKLAEDQPFFPVVRNAPLAEIADAAAQDQLTPCD